MGINGFFSIVTAIYVVTKYASILLLSVAKETKKAELRHKII